MSGAPSTSTNPWWRAFFYVGFASGVVFITYNALTVLAMAKLFPVAALGVMNLPFTVCLVPLLVVDYAIGFWITYGPVLFGQKDRASEVASTNNKRNRWDVGMGGVLLLAGLAFRVNDALFILLMMHTLGYTWVWALVTWLVTGGTKFLASWLVGWQNYSRMRMLKPSERMKRLGLPVRVMSSFCDFYMDILSFCVQKWVAVTTLSLAVYAALVGFPRLVNRWMFTVSTFTYGAEGREAKPVHPWQQRAMVALGGWSVVMVSLINVFGLWTKQHMLWEALGASGRVAVVLASVVAVVAWVGFIVFDTIHLKRSYGQPPTVPETGDTVSAKALAAELAKRPPPGPKPAADDTLCNAVSSDRAGETGRSHQAATQKLC